MVELSDQHGITGDQEVEPTRIRMKYGKRYKVSVRCQSNQVGELKIPVVVVFYHDALSEEAEDEENEIGMVQSIMLVELLVRTKTKPNVPERKVSATTGQTRAEESLIQKKAQSTLPHGWQCTLCSLVNPVDVSMCGNCNNTWFKWQTGSICTQTKLEVSNRKVSMATEKSLIRKQEGEGAIKVGRLLETFEDQGASGRSSDTKKETSGNHTVPDVLKEIVLRSSGESPAQEKLGKGGVTSGWECSSCAFVNTSDVSVCGECDNTVPNLLWFRWEL